MKEKGITLIALIVTIIILIILAGITIGVLIGDEGLIGNANDAKEQTEIANEKEIVDRATINAMGNNPRGNIVEDELQNELDKITNVGDTDVEDNGEEFEVVFVNTNRYYTVDKQGDIIDEGKIVIDKSPGDITKDENGDDIEEGKPFEIWCIEDLVAFSNMVNGSGIILENSKAIEINTSTNFSNKTVELKTNLNFKSKYSYADSERTDFGNINGDENDGNTLMNEMTTGTGFKPIGTTKNSFIGTFNGNQNVLYNIYENQEDLAGLFLLINSNTIIKNLEITGEITSSNSMAGGIVASVSSSIYSGNIVNCYNKCNVNGNTYAGGIIGHAYAVDVELDNCYNSGNITGKIAAGILSRNGGDRIKTIINNCFNIGNITGTIESTSGGILGEVTTMTLQVNNSYNLGKIRADKYAGGMIGYSRYTVNINNSYNAGKIYPSGKADIIVPEIWNNKINLNNFFYDNSNLIDGVTIYNNNAIPFQNSKEEINKIVNLLNSFKDDNDNYPSNWNRWKLGENGYPIFE